jgi:hypothetical protein
VAKIEVITEEEKGNGWVYRVAVERDAGAGEGKTEHTVRLAWVDHEHWSGGRVQPSKVIEVLMGLLAGRNREIPAEFDAAAVRRWWSGVDAAMQGRV